MLTDVKYKRVTFACELQEELPGETDYKIIRSKRTPLPLKLSQMSPETEDSGGLGMFVICQEITSLVKLTNKISNDSRREDH